MQKRFTLLLVLLFQIAITQAQQNYTGNQAADRVQKARSDAGDLFEKKNASPADIGKGIMILKNALLFLDSLPIQEMAKTNAYLYYRRPDALRDLADGYVLAHKKDSALMMLEKMYASGSTSGVAGFLKQDSTFIPLHNEPRYQVIVSKLENQGTLWKNTALKTPYKTNLTQAEKVAGLSLLWSQAKYNFVNFDHLTADWNQIYLDYLPKVQATNSTADYYKVLISFYAQLKDGHTNVYAPDSLNGEFYSRPPFRTELIEGRVFVTQVMSDSLLKSGISPGLELIKINSEPVIGYAEKNIKPYQSSSTPQDLEVREFTYALLAGSKNKPLELQFKDRNGKMINRSISRTGYHDVRGLKTMEYQTIGNIGYLTINNFEDKKIVQQFDSLYTQISKTKGLIIDIRYNGGGDGGIGFNIISRLTDKSFQYAASKTLKFASKPNAEPEWSNNGPGYWGASGKIYYNKPVIVLIGPRTFSAAEDFTVAFDYMKRGKLVGMLTGGSTGQPVPFNLPGGGTARVCGKRDTYPDGREFVGIGIKPDVVVKKTVKDLLSGKDAAKDKALEMLNK